VDLSFVAILSLAVGFAALGTTILIAHKQGKLTNEIHENAREQDRLLADTRDSYAGAFVGHVRRVSGIYHHVISLYEKEFYGRPRSPEKEDMQEALQGYYDDHLFNLPKIEFIELVKVFGREIACMHRTYTAKLTSNMWQAYSDHGMALMIHSYKEEMNKLLKLKDEFLPYCDEEYRNQDKDFEEKYRLIKQCYKSAKKPKKEEFESDE